MKIGEMLEQARLEKGYSPDEVAAGLGITRRHWDRIVKGESSNIRLDTASRVKAFLGVSLDALMETEEAAFFAVP